MEVGQAPYKPLLALASPICVGSSWRRPSLSVSSSQPPPSAEGSRESTQGEHTNAQIGVRAGLWFGRLWQPNFKSIDLKIKIKGQ